MKRLLLIAFLSTCVFAEQKNLLVFLDKELEEKIGTEFNVSYQFAVALMQRSGEILVAQSLLQNIVQRKELFQKNLKKYGSVESEFFKMFNAVQNNIARKSIDSINECMNQKWFAQNFAQIERLSEEKYKQVAFNFYCFYLCKTLHDWSFVEQNNGFILCSLQQHPQSLSQNDILVLHASPQKSIIPALQSLTNNKQDEWVVYLSGHGQSKSDGEQALISGMKVSEFRLFLQYLEEQMNTRLLVYNSCFAGGRDGLSVYKINDKELLLSYSIIMTSIADAPTYVFGTPSGFKLPPYSSHNQLEASDVRDGRLQPFYLQFFSEFFDYAHRQFCDDSCMFLINRYKQCVEQGCSVYQVENIPMIRHAHSNKFTPLDERDHFVVDGIKKDKIVLEDQKVAMWYQQEYEGSIYCVGSVPIFISMLHEKINRHKIRELVVSANIETFLSQAFVSLEDRETETVWNIDSVTVQTRSGKQKYKNVKVVQNKQGTTWKF